MDEWRDDVTYRPIGVVRTAHTDPARTPIQPKYASGVEGRIEIDPEYEEGLDDLEGFSHIVLLYHLHRARPPRLKVVPFLDDVPHGVFATRAPSRPNPIGLSVVRLLRRDGRILHIADVDVLDGTPLLDIKPHIERFGVDGPVRGGWQAGIGNGDAERVGRRESTVASEGVTRASSNDEHTEQRM
jgi:tRNA-Thr(GGU) m(6)t(6)A37 methyltransferase TsaA